MRTQLKVRNYYYDNPNYMRHSPHTTKEKYSEYLTLMQMVRIITILNYEINYGTFAVQNRVRCLIVMNFVCKMLAFSYFNMCDRTVMIICSVHHMCRVHDD